MSARCGMNRFDYTDADLAGLLREKLLVLLSMVFTASLSGKDFLLSESEGADVCTRPPV